MPLCLCSRAVCGMGLKIGCVVSVVRWSEVQSSGVLVGHPSGRSVSCAGRTLRLGASEVDVWPVRGGVCVGFWRGMCGGFSFLLFSYRSWSRMSGVRRGWDSCSTIAGAGLRGTVGRSEMRLKGCCSPKWGCFLFLMPGHAAHRPERSSCVQHD